MTMEDSTNTFGSITMENFVFVQTRVNVRDQHW